MHNPTVDAAGAILAGRADHDVVAPDVERGAEPVAGSLAVRASSLLTQGIRDELQAVDDVHGAGIDASTEVLVWDTDRQHPFVCGKRGAEAVAALGSVSDDAVALIMAHLDASHGADVLAALPEALRAEVAMRMASLEEISPQVIRRISMILEQKLEAIGGFNVEEYGGVRAVAEMFNRMERNVGRQVLEKIESINPDMAASIRDLMFVFDDILLIDDQGIAEILKRVDRKALSYALKGTSEELQAQIFRNMSSRAVEMLKEEMEYLGAVKLKEVEKAQHQIVEVVRQLEEEGIITIGGGGGGDEYVT